MKNRDFRLFDLSNLPEMTDSLAKSIITEIGDKIYSNQNQKVLFKTKISELFGSKCSYCGAPLDNLASEQIDHFVPKDETNINNPKNLLLACFLCNNSKRKVLFSYDLYPYQKSFSHKFKRDSYGFIVPASNEDEGAFLMAEQLHFAYLSRSITYIYLLVDYLILLLSNKNDERYNSLIASLATFERKVRECSNLLCLKEIMKNNR